LISAHAQPQAAAAVFPRADLLPAPTDSPPPTLYDEQLGTTFTQSFTSLEYNVTAVEQVDPGSGTGPAYLLNGLSGKGLLALRVEISGLTLAWVYMAAVNYLFSTRLSKRIEGARAKRSFSGR
jgi:hypothetical protein